MEVLPRTKEAILLLKIADSEVPYRLAEDEKPNARKLKTFGLVELVDSEDTATITDEGLNVQFGLVDAYLEYLE